MVPGPKFFFFVLVHSWNSGSMLPNSNALSAGELLFFCFAWKTGAKLKQLIQGQRGSQVELVMPTSRLYNLEGGSSALTYPLGPV